MFAPHRVLPQLSKIYLMHPNVRRFHYKMPPLQYPKLWENMFLGIADGPMIEDCASSRSLSIRSVSSSRIDGTIHKQIVSITAFVDEAIMGLFAVVGHEKEPNRHTVDLYVMHTVVNKCNEDAFQISPFQAKEEEVLDKLSTESHVVNAAVLLKTGATAVTIPVASFARIQVKKCFFFGA